MAKGRARGLYSPDFEHDSCGFGLIASIDDQPSRHILNAAMTALQRLTHRGAVDADGKTGDGCGLLMKFPAQFLRLVAREASIEPGKNFAVGQVFLDQDSRRADVERMQLEQEIRRLGLEVAGWREVPVNPEACGKRALQLLPRIEQVFINAPSHCDAQTFDRKLFVARRKTELALDADDSDFYVCSLSCQTLSYKGMVMPAFLQEFYPDLARPELVSSVCVFHQRFSTNTLPQWRLAQPFRFLAHNGEINTIQGNRNWAHARRNTFRSELLPELGSLTPIVSLTGSDSQSLDNMLEVLQAGGMDVLQAMRLLIPPAWQTVDSMDSELRAFYEFYAAHMEPWDGPAGIVLTDGRFAACLLDRNGLRPARYLLTRERVLVIASETGIYNCPDAEIIEKGRLGPGEMLALDLEKKRVLYNREISDLLKARAPFKKWLKQGVRYLDSELVDKRITATPFERAELVIYEKLFDISFEERTEVIRVLAEAEAEAIGSMGDDTPIAVLSSQVRSLYDYFRQQFAQVTNPPIDPLREQIVMSLQTEIGKEFNVFCPEPEHARQIVLNSPVLSQRKLRQILDSEAPVWRNTFIDLNRDQNEELPAALLAICREAEEAVRKGTVVIVLSDRYIKPDKLPVHALLATGAVHHHLIEEGLRSDCNIIVETGTARDPHHFACLIGYGATAVYPFMAYQCLADMIRVGEIRSDYSRAQLGRSYRRGIRKGLLKIMSKMGISTIASYRAAGLFEIVGLGDEVVDRCFPRTVSRIQGASFADLEEDRRYLATRAWDQRVGTSPGGLLKYVDGGEVHMYSAEVVGALQAAVSTNNHAKYAEYRDLVNNRPIGAVRDMLGLRKPGKPISIDEVEPIEKIVARFDCAGMSLGALSPEAHEALAVAMNRLGARSNSGEGGEDPARHGTERMSKIKQVASGRFGVTPEYLVNAEVIQIKMAQGAKPGEGGQLPGHKVNKTIAELRFANPGVGLISPPPHHDIYSIEDLAQLIFDLKQVNPDAQVSVKLVAEPGVGTIAAGVTKAYADLITISGHDGGTGASPLTSVKYAGSPWEIGLAEARQVLRANGLRQKVQLQADGGLKTGLDVVKAALLGAESFGFGTAPLVALGCKYLRICHLNNCATGVATQNDVLRKHHFVGLPEMVERYFRFVAQEVRELMAELGVRKLDELIGAVEYLEILPGQTVRQDRLDLTPLLAEHGLDSKLPRRCLDARNMPFDKGPLAEQMLKDMAVAIKKKKNGRFAYAVRNSDRSVGARISGEIARQHGNYGMQDTVLDVRLRGSAGQSLGAWNATGLHIHLTGDANDYVGKGMAGGEIVLRPPHDVTYAPNETVIMGNTCLYGATGGELYAAGCAGERFAVRNSGAIAVVEGVGDHCCEYMTGGVVVVLGRTGLNFGAGMTGGFAYVLDTDRTFYDQYNHELIDVRRITLEGTEAHLRHLHNLISAHVEKTGSSWGQAMLDDYRSFRGLFWLVKPKAADIDSLIESLRGAA